MVHYYSADYLIPVVTNPIKGGVIGIDDKGVVVEIYDSFTVPDGLKIKKLKGVLIPGFINTHCHLELSHMIGKIPEKTGLVGFITEVMSKRSADEKQITEAMVKADKAMYDNGIQAVGDHVNSAISAQVKEKSKMVYHTFVEIIGMKTEDAAPKIDEARDIEFHFNPAHSSITPHAPYSCSRALFKVFKKSVGEDNIISIHNQESEEENKLYRYKTGDFIDFFAKFNIPTDDFKAQARNSIQSYLTFLPNSNKTILVHNTFTSLKDLDFIRRMERNVVLCLCPKANLYIENSLPKVNVFGQERFDIALGTDSLASNNSLSILEELKALHDNFKDLDFLETIKWATLNGAKALGLEKTLGSLEKGKAPGLVLLKNMEQLKLTDKVTVERIV